jgi:DNA-binding Lrp family transcriptional regulator
MVLNPFFYYFIMDFFDERILAVLSDGKPKVLAQLLGEVDFSRNTMKLHLKRLLSQGLVVKEKMPLNRKGRPKFAYSTPLRIRQQVSAALSDPRITIISLPFSRLRHLCRFEKGGYCKQARKNCSPENCPQLPKAKE